jgi:signal transduction histidine kinase
MILFYKIYCLLSQTTHLGTMKSLTHPQQKNHSHFFIIEFFSKLFSATHPSRVETTQQSSTVSNQQSEIISDQPSKIAELAKTNEELKLSIQNLTLSNQKLLNENHHKSEFLASIAHELKNQIGAIISLSEFIKSESCDKIEKKDSEEKSFESVIKEYATDIHNVSVEMLEFTCDLMDVHQAESGQFSVDLSKEIDIADVIKKSVRINNDFALRRGIQIKVDDNLNWTPQQARGDKGEALGNKNINCEGDNIVASHPDCHPAFIAGSSKIHLDARRMKQILTNLISNAIKYSPEKSEIKISCKENQKLLEITICDQGFGMSEEEIEIALQKHQRIKNKNFDKFDSFGLGLPLVKNLVELQKGEMEIKSKENEGTEIILKFPYLM